MERIIQKVTIALVALLFAVQGYLFYRDYDGVAYAADGQHMSETTYLYARDELTITTKGVLPPDFQIWKNGEPLAIAANEEGAYTFEVKTYDLVEISGADGENGALAEIWVSLAQGVFRESYYAELFDYTGGRVTIGWFLEK